MIHVGILYYCPHGQTISIFRSFLPSFGQRFWYNTSNCISVVLQNSVSHFIMMKGRESSLSGLIYLFHSPSNRRSKICGCHQQPACFWPETNMVGAGVQSSRVQASDNCVICAVDRAWFGSHLKSSHVSDTLEQQTANFKLHSKPVATSTDQENKL